MIRTDLIAAGHHGEDVTHPDALSRIVDRGLSAAAARPASMSPRRATPLDTARPVTAREETGEP
ncbi:hypothetical protein [Streptomyces europaeiscabiei]|uniref:hypothetical protein n=1 Tax=Streptomyces europaeiscabiei TaxID=146819 RepID=UPI0029B22B6A|nr:hypothetical protein [Streptomyces europaeiscabiei]MDX2771270.1 hypothetical protein [Streptomyces europaeiscabiei]